MTCFRVEVGGGSGGGGGGGGGGGAHYKAVFLWKPYRVLSDISA